jgi:hypothetical protein
MKNTLQLESYTASEIQAEIQHETSEDISDCLARQRQKEFVCRLGLGIKIHGKLSKNRKPVSFGGSVSGTKTNPVCSE